MSDLRGTVLLARPGVTRERLRVALEQAGVEVVMEADPLEIGVERIGETKARNLVIAVDAEVEDALDRFDSILADQRYRILFEEAVLVGARDGWDAARWSRHLGAKLLGHGDVLPEGHEPDDLPTGDDSAASLAESTGPGQEAASTSARALDDDQPGSGLIDQTQEASTTEASADWTRFQDFEAINELPAASTPPAAEHDFRAPLPTLDRDELPHDQVDGHLEEQVSQFEAEQSADRWQDVDRPTVDDGTPVPEAMETLPPEAPSWSLADEPIPPPATSASDAGDGLAGLGDRIAGLSLVEEDDAYQAELAQVSTSHGEAVVSNADSLNEGAVLLVGGIGGPDPLRQILQQLGETFCVPVLVQQWLDGGQYDRLVRQMDRASRMPVELAQAGKTLQANHVYVVPTGITVSCESNGTMQFAAVSTRGFADVVSALPVGSSGVVLLSGTSEDFVVPVQRFQQGGGHVIAQSAEGCYDHVVPALLIQHGVEAHLPTGIATQLAARWQQQVSP